jgi:hypothetical protein
LKIKLSFLTFLFRINSLMGVPYALPYIQYYYMNDLYQKSVLICITFFLIYHSPLRVCGYTFIVYICISYVLFSIICCKALCYSCSPFYICIILFLKIHLYVPVCELNEYFHSSIHKVSFGIFTFSYWSFICLWTSDMYFPLYEERKTNNDMLRQ